MLTRCKNLRITLGRLYFAVSITFFHTHLLDLSLFILLPELATSYDLHIILVEDTTTAASILLTNSS